MLEPRGSTPSPRKPVCSAAEYASRKQLTELLDAQGHICALSGAPLTPENATVDHIRARSEGGSNTAENLQWVLKTVNRAKGSMTVQDFVSMCCRVADAHRAKGAESAPAASSGSPAASPESVAPNSAAA